MYVFLVYNTVRAVEPVAVIIVVVVRGGLYSRLTREQGVEYLETRTVRPSTNTYIYSLLAAAVVYIPFLQLSFLRARPRVLSLKQKNSRSEIKRDETPCACA